MRNIKTMIKESSKTEKFLIIIISIITLSIILTFLVQEIVHSKNKEDLKILLIAPDKRVNPYIRESMENGVTSFIDKTNNQKYSKYNLSLEIINENNPNLMSTLKSKISKEKYKAIVGFYDKNIFEKNKNSLNSLSIPIYTINKNISVNDNVYSINSNEDKKSKFTANYIRNVKKELVTYFAHDTSPRCQNELTNFNEIYKKFKIPLSGVVSTKEDIKNYFSKVDFGAVYICGDYKSIPKILNQINNSGTELNIYSSEELSLNSVKKSIQNSASILNDISITTPILFDTSNKEAQNFLNRYKKLYNESPDWLSASMYDLSMIAFSKKDKKSTTFKGVLNDYDFSKINHIYYPIKMGIFNGKQLISTPIQLQEIENDKSIDNYIQALREGRVLFVDNRFMYKTNVVYTGININSIDNIRQDEDSVNLDLSIWFRYQGDFDPKDIVFLNSNVLLENPEEKIDQENDHYIRYRVKGIFKLNYSKEDKAYGINSVNIVYRHKKLNYNNLLFVTDILGMPQNTQIIQNIQDKKVISSTENWEATEFWISQSLMKDTSEGKPQFIGYRGDKPLFSVVNVELKVEPSMLNAKDFIPKEYFIFLLLLSIVGLVSAILMDSKQLGRYWVMQSFFLRFTFLPMFVISAGNLLLDWAFVNLNQILTGNLVLLYESIWWIIPAYILNMGIKRFVWQRLEDKAQKKIPAIMIMVSTFVIYALAIAGAIAFVFEKELTSMLAASGVLAMVIGLAIKSNIANIFSGLILNIDKPIRVGEKIIIGNYTGTVLDISWRTTKLRTWDGLIITIPNDSISDTNITNLDRSHEFGFTYNIYLEPNFDPEIGIKLIKEALMQINVDKIILKDDPDWGVVASYFGLKVEENTWVSHFRIFYSTAKRGDKKPALSQFFRELYRIFERENIEMQLKEKEHNNFQALKEKYTQQNFLEQ